MTTAVLAERLPPSVALIALSVCALLSGAAGAEDSGHWIADASGCQVFNPKPVAGESIQWSGTCRDGFADGHGVLQWQHSDGKLGTRIEASFVHGMAEGQGTSLSPSGARYEGDFHHNEAEGHGRIVWPNGVRYEGDWQGGHITGQGILTRPSGGRYEGTWVMGRWSGHGSYVSDQGERYEGDWQDGLCEGHGVFTSAGGERWEGEWHLGLPVGETVPEGARNFVKALPDRSQASYALGERFTGSRMLRKTYYNFRVPPDSPYEELTAEQQNLIKSQYEAMAEGDEPPYPAHGPGEVMRAEGQVRRRALRNAPPFYGEVEINVTVGPDGHASRIEVLKSPDHDYTHLLAQLLLSAPYKPARCQGQPCQMDYPFRLNLTRGSW